MLVTHYFFTFKEVPSCPYERFPVCGWNLGLRLSHSGTTPHYFPHLRSHITCMFGNAKNYFIQLTAVMSQNWSVGCCKCVLQQEIHELTRKCWENLPLEYSTKSVVIAWHYSKITHLPPVNVRTLSKEYNGPCSYFQTLQDHKNV